MLSKIEIGKRISTFRKSIDLKQVEFAKGLEISQQALSQIEHGSILPSLDILQKITSKYCISYDSLIDGPDAHLNAHPNAHLSDTNALYKVKEEEPPGANLLCIEKDKLISALNDTINAKDQLISALTARLSELEKRSYSTGQKRKVG